MEINMEEISESLTLPSFLFSHCQLLSFLTTQGLSFPILPSLERTTREGCGSFCSHASKYRREVHGSGLLSKGKMTSEVLLQDSKTVLICTLGKYAT